MNVEKLGWSNQIINQLQKYFSAVSVSFPLLQRTSRITLHVTTLEDQIVLSK